MLSRIPSEVAEVATALMNAGGDPYITGGACRDLVLGREPKDWDIEVFKLPLAKVEAALAGVGEVGMMGAAHGVLLCKGVEVGVPRTDNKVGPGHADFEYNFDPQMSVSAAARRRDFTMNALYFDLKRMRLLDPSTKGMRHIGIRYIYPVDTVRFGDDALRPMRAARFAAELGFDIAPQVLDRSAGIPTSDYDALSGERRIAELEKILMSPLPGYGLSCLSSMSYSLLPVLSLLKNTRQSWKHHPEGDVLIHTCMVVDAMRRIITRENEIQTHRTGAPHCAEWEKTMMWAAFFHDFGKPACTLLDTETSDYTAHGHERESVVAMARFCEEYKGVSTDIQLAASVLVEEHLFPFQAPGKAKRNAYVARARALGNVGLTMADLALLAEADHRGRTTAEALLSAENPVAPFLKDCARYGVTFDAPLSPSQHRGAVTGKYLLSLGHKPGKELGNIISACLAIQDETGESDPDVIFGAYSARETEATPSPVVA